MVLHIVNMFTQIIKEVILPKTQIDCRRDKITIDLVPPRIMHGPLLGQELLFSIKII